MKEIQKNTKVVCTEDYVVNFEKSTPKEYKDIELPEKGVEYSVREIVNTKYGKGLRFKEIVNEEIYHDQGGWQEPIFKIEKFNVV